MVDPQWITGFTDGEGCFSLIVHKDKHNRKDGSTVTYYRWVAIFNFGLRGDDSNIAQKFKEYFHCGVTSMVYGKETAHHSYGKCYYSTRSLKELTGVIIPHFDKYPLQSKKQIDYVLWREAVLLLAESRENHKLFNKIELSEKTKQRLQEIHLEMRKRLTATRTTWDYKNLDMDGARQTEAPEGQLGLL